MSAMPEPGPAREHPRKLGRSRSWDLLEAGPGCSVLCRDGVALVQHLTSVAHFYLRDGPYPSTKQFPSVRAYSLAVFVLLRVAFSSDLFLH